jgi:hypothetical protein
MDEEKIVRLLPCPLTEPEVAERAQELALAELFRCQVADELSAEKNEWNERKKYLEGRVSTASHACERLGRVVKDRQEERAVDCLIIIDGATYQIVRTDTGEIVVKRPATPGELQMALPVDAIGG